MIFAADILGSLFLMPVLLLDLAYLWFRLKTKHEPEWMLAAGVGAACILYAAQSPTVIALWPSCAPVRWLLSLCRRWWRCDITDMHDKATEDLIHILRHQWKISRYGRKPQ